VRLYLINPSNPLVSITRVAKSRWSSYRVWKPLGLLVVAGLTPAEWDITLIDENLGIPDYAAMPRPDLVGITAFTSQAPSAYKLAAGFRRRGVPVVMGGIHASMRTAEAAERADAVVTGEAESVWAQVLDDARRGQLRHLYAGGRQGMEKVPPARHDLLTAGYRFGSIQTTRGCPLNCSFCSVWTFNGRQYRHRPVEQVLEEFKTIREKYVLIVDDNLIGTRPVHSERAKDLFRAMIDAKLDKRWFAQVTINMADDEDLLLLAAKAGCVGVFVGFESPTKAGLLEVSKKFNLKAGRNFRDCVRRIQRHGIVVVGSFIMGLDVDQKGIGLQIAEAGIQYGVDIINVLFLTPLPGTRLWEKMEKEGRIAANSFPEDWKYYTLTFPVANYKHLSWSEMIREMDLCSRKFYSYRRIFGRGVSQLWRTHNITSTLWSMLSNFSYRDNTRLGMETCLGMDLSRGRACAEVTSGVPQSR